jgi:hypothetical protein
MAIAVIADIVGSRRLPDRAAAQRALDTAIARVERDLPVATVPMRPIVGDEQQAVYPSLDSALASLLLLQLALPDGIECRFGIGIGSVGSLATAVGDIHEGPGWWAAREAIDAVHAKQQRAAPSARTWVVAAPEEDGPMHHAARLANAYLLARDEVVGAMTDRTRRLTYGRCRRVPQRELADAEGISQPAVSQALAAAGAAAVVEGYFALVPGATA